MMTNDQLAAILLECQYKDWQLDIVFDNHRPYLQWHFTAPDYTKPGRPLTKWPCRKHYLSLFMTESELVQTAFMAALQAEEHECREAFHYRGARPFHPHIDISALMAASHHVVVRS